MPVWAIFLLGAAGFMYLVKQGQIQAGQSPFAIGQTGYLQSATSLQVSGQSVTLQAGTRVYVQTSDTSGVTQIRTDSGNVGTVPTSAIGASLPVGVSMQVN
jgi:hypothetical protein